MIIHDLLTKACVPTRMYDHHRFVIVYILYGLSLLDDLHSLFTPLVTITFRAGQDARGL